MVCLVITRNGTGDVWSFKDLVSARLSPISQQYDVFACNADELIRQYSRDQINNLLRFVEGREKSKVIDAIEGWRVGVQRTELSAEIRLIIWNKVLSAANKPPSASEDLIRIITQDRVALEGKVLYSRSEAHEVAPVKTPSKPTGDNDMAERKRLNDAATITLLAETNPKRAGSASHAYFENYKTGMTIAEAKAAGITPAALRYDTEHGYISITEPAEQAAA